MLRLISLIFFCILVCCENVSKNEIIEYIPGQPEGLDPSENLDLFGTRIYSNIYESLVNLGDDGLSIVPGLASNWNVEKNLTRYIFYLEPGRLFHDGSPVNADAVVYSFQRQIHKNSTTPLFNMVESVESINNLTFSINLKYPYTQFLFSLTSPIGFKVISKIALEKYGDGVDKIPVGSGPFFIEDWKKDDRITLKKFKHYPRFSGNVERIIFKKYDNYSKLVNEFQQGDFDILYSVPGFYIDRLRWLGMIEYMVIKPFSVVFLGFNNTSEVLKNVFLRRLIYKSIDRSRLVNNILRGNSVVANGPLPSIFSINGLNSEESIIQSVILDRDSVKYTKNNLTLKLFYVPKFFARNTIFEVLKKELLDIGISLEMIPFDSYETLNKACRSDSAQLFFNTWQADVLGDPENFLYSLFYSTSEYNFFHYTNPRVDNWLDSARIETVWEKRQVLYQKIEGQVLEDMPAVFLYHVIPVYAYNKNRIKSLPVNPYGIINYHRVVLHE